MRSMRHMLMAVLVGVSLVAGTATPTIAQTPSPSEAPSPSLASAEDDGVASLGYTVTIVNAGKDAKAVETAVGDYLGVSRKKAKARLKKLPLILATGLPEEEAKELAVRFVLLGAAARQSPDEPEPTPTPYWSPRPTAEATPRPSPTPPPSPSPPPGPPSRSVDDLLAPLAIDEVTPTREEIEDRYRAGFWQTMEIQKQPSWEVVASVRIPEYSEVGAYVRTCGRGSFKSPPREQRLHKQTACYLAVWSEWMDYIQGTLPSVEVHFDRAREIYLYALEQLGPKDRQWLGESLAASLPASEAERQSHAGQGKKGFAKLIKSKPKERVTAEEFVRAVRDAVATDPTGSMLDVGYWGFEGMTVPHLPSLPEKRYVNVAFAGACARDLNRATQWISPKHSENMQAVPPPVGACAELTAALWGLWRETGQNAYRTAAEKTWAFTRQNVTGISIRAVLWEMNPDRRW